MVADGFAGVTKGVKICIVWSCSFARRMGPLKSWAHLGILVHMEWLRESDGHFFLFWAVVEPGTRSPSALRGRGGPGGGSLAPKASAISHIIVAIAVK